MKYFIPLTDIIKRLDHVAERLNARCERIDDEIARIEDDIADASRSATPEEAARITDLEDRIAGYEKQLEIVIEAVNLLEQYRIAEDT